MNVTRYIFRSILFFVSAAQCLIGLDTTPAQEKPRLLVLTDIGGDPDDQQSLVRLLTYANEFDLEGLIASASGTPGELKENVVRTDLILATLAAYGEVRDNLEKHAHGFPTQGALEAVVRAGNPVRGMKRVGREHDTAGSRWIIELADRADARPLNIAIWGGSTDLAQALWHARATRSPAELQELLGRLRVHSISHQDETGPWIVEEFPDLFYVLSAKSPNDVVNPEASTGDKRDSVYRGMYLGGDESLTSREWIEEHVRRDHGPLGAPYPNRTWTAPNPHSALKEGDTPSWFYFLPTGLSDPEHPEWGSWGGRFVHRERGLYRDAADMVDGQTHPRATVWRWRPHYQNDFQARMDWCVRSRAEANHPPQPVLEGDTTRDVLVIPTRAGTTLRLSGEGTTDPDGDRLAYRWWAYREAGSYGGELPIINRTSQEIAVEIPADAAGRTIHVILEAHDDGAPPLVRYRRAVLEVGR